MKYGDGKIGTQRSLRSAWLQAVAFSVACVMSIASASRATEIEFIETGSGSGSIGGVAFQTSNFTVTSTADIANRASFLLEGNSGFNLINDSTSIDISGIGTINFLTPTTEFVNNTVHGAGFLAGPSSLDLYHSPIDLSFASWNLISSIGPINGTGALLQWSENPVSTNDGILVFDNNADLATSL